MTKKKIAVLGGGMSAMTSIYELLLADNFENNYDITVYQLGWRIGGKGASGRNPEIGQRIEEHGLHMWFGMYNNAFNLIQDCYKRLNRPPGSPLATWKDAFKPHNRLVATEWFDNKWHFNEVLLPHNNEEPGGDKEFLPIEDYIEMLLQMILHRFEESDFAKNHPSRNKGCLSYFPWIKKAENAVIDDMIKLLDDAVKHAAANKSNFKTANHPSHSTLIDMLERFLIWLKNEVGNLMGHTEDTRCMFILVDAGLSVIIGVIRDQVLIKGFDSINKYDLREWMSLNGASPITVDSALIRGAYNAMFAYENGDDSKPNMEAGTSLKASILGLGIKGSVMWKMQAGMGDTIFAPIYDVLKQHGVKFKFFHKVRNLQLSADKQSIAAIQLGIQATLAEGVEEYDPLVNVNNLQCWPSEPHYSQLKQGKELEDNNINLESLWTPWKDVEEKTLVQGEDFDTVILGTSIASLPHICPELIAANPAWASMVENVQTTQTQAFQLWTNKDVAEMGWPFKAGVMGAYAQPMDTWAGMNQLIDKEAWPEGYEPKNISYWCGPLKNAAVIPPPTAHEFPAQMENAVLSNVKDYINQDVQQQWPNSYTPQGFDWNLLIDLQNRTGENRLNSQFWRANIDPSERYVLTVKGSSQYRLCTDVSGFNNLYITGDWIDNGFNFGCIEACAMAGIYTARAISGKHIKIVGEEITRHP